MSKFVYGTAVLALVASALMLPSVSAAPVTSVAMPPGAVESANVSAGDAVGMDISGFDNSAVVSTSDPAVQCDPVALPTDPNVVCTMPEADVPDTYTITVSDGTNADAVLTVDADDTPATLVPSSGSHDAGSSFTFRVSDIDNAATSIVAGSGLSCTGPIADGTITCDVDDFAPSGDVDVVVSEDHSLPSDDTVTYTATITQVLDATVTLDPSTAQPGDAVSVGADGLQPSSTVDIVLVNGTGDEIQRLDSVDVGADGTIDESLSLSDTTPVGSLTVRVLTGRSNPDSTPEMVTAPLTVQPQFDADPDTVGPLSSSTKVHLEGSGFADSQDATIVVKNSNGDTMDTFASFSTDAQGDITADIGLSSSYIPGVYDVEVTLDNGQKSSTKFTLSEPTSIPMVTLPSDMILGNSYPIRGTGYLPGMSVEVVITLPDGATRTQTVTASSSGTWVASTGTIGQYGDYRVQASQGRYGLSDDTITVTDPNPVDPTPTDPTPTTEPTPVDPGPVGPGPVNPGPIDPNPAPVNPNPAPQLSFEPPAPEPEPTKALDFSDSLLTEEPLQSQTPAFQGEYAVSSVPTLDNSATVVPVPTFYPSPSAAPSPSTPSPSSSASASASGQPAEPSASAEPVLPTTNPADRNITAAPDSGFPWWILIVAGALALAAIGIFFFLSKRNDDEDEEEPEPEEETPPHARGL